MAAPKKQKLKAVEPVDAEIVPEIVPEPSAVEKLIASNAEELNKIRGGELTFRAGMVRGAEILGSQGIQDAMGSEEEFKETLAKTQKDMPDASVEQIAQHMVQVYMTRAKDVILSARQSWHDDARRLEGRAAALEQQNKQLQDAVK